jgi:hypothetical protein
MNRKAMHANVVAVPWPGHFHLRLGSAYFSTPIDAAAVAGRKTWLAMESFATRMPIRKRLRTQCYDYPDECVHYEPEVCWLAGSAHLGARELIFDHSFHTGMAALGCALFWAVRC